jgi:hypothetical protein
VLFETFSVEVKSEGGKKTEQIALCENGENRDVDEDNKQEYVKAMGEWRVKYSVLELLDSFMAGLNMLVPNELLRQFTIPELELLFNGKTNIDVDEIRAYSIFQGNYTATSKEGEGGGGGGYRTLKLTPLSRSSLVLADPERTEGREQDAGAALHHRERSRPPRRIQPTVQHHRRLRHGRGRPAASAHVLQPDRPAPLQDERSHEEETRASDREHGRLRAILDNE